MRDDAGPGTLPSMTQPPVAAGELDVRRPFTRADAVAAGIDPKTLRTSRFRRIFRGVYIGRDVVPTPRIRAEAALVLHPETAFVSHLSAARLYGLPVPDSPEEHVSVLRQEDRRKRSGMRSHVARAPVRVAVKDGVRVSRPEQMFVELASMLALVDLVIVGDALVRTFGIDAERLRAWCATSTGRHARLARVAARYVRDEVDSPMETRLRMLIVLAGLPEPVVNHKIRDTRGRVRLRLDLSYPAWKLIVEYDGRQHARDVAQWRRDLQRREYFDDEEWKILVVTSEGVFVEPEQTLLRVRRALRSRGCPDLPRQLDDAWRAHFPTR
jgi:very-short-patch-repair endonuclease